MPILYKTLLRALTVVAAGLLLSLSSAQAHDRDHHRDRGHDRNDITATVTGQVVDTDGRPVADVIVSSGALTTTTDPGGIYSLAGVKPKSRVIINFSKDGYALNQGVVGLIRTTTGGTDDEDDDHDRGHKKDKHEKKPEHHRVKLDSATLNRTLLPAGATQTFNSNSGGSLSQDGFVVSIPADSLTVSGEVDITISPIDVSTNQIDAAPGNFAARSATGLRVQLETFSMADFHLSQNGNPVNLKPGASAGIELLLPENTPLLPGDTTPLWYYNTNTGLWQEEGRGDVAPSSLLAGRLAVYATVFHFSYWNSDQPLNSTAVTGRVVDGNGLPLGGVTVGGHGVDYAGTSYAVPTDVNGNYCIQVKTSSTTALTASYTIPGASFESAPVNVTTGATTSTCATGAAYTAADITLSLALSCVHGDVLDGSNQPVVAATVYTSSGGYTVTDASGSFQIPLPELTTVMVYTSGYPSLTVTTPAVGEPCASAPIRAEVGGSGPACLTGVVYQCDPANPIVGQTVEAMDMGEHIVGVSNPTAADGSYCIDNLPVNENVWLFTGGGGTETLTGNGGGSCAAHTCNAAPPIDAYCY